MKDVFEGYVTYVAPEMNPKPEPKPDDKLFNLEEPKTEPANEPVNETVNEPVNEPSQNMKLTEDDYTAIAKKIAELMKGGESNECE